MTLPTQARMFRAVFLSIFAQSAAKVLTVEAFEESSRVPLLKRASHGPHGAENLKGNKSLELILDSLPAHLQVKARNAVRRHQSLVESRGAAQVRAKGQARSDPVSVGDQATMDSSQHANRKTGACTCSPLDTSPCAGMTCVNNGQWLRNNMQVACAGTSELTGLCEEEGGRCVPKTNEDYSNFCGAAKDTDGVCFNIDNVGDTQLYNDRCSSLRGFMDEFMGAGPERIKESSMPCTPKITNMHGAGIVDDEYNIQSCCYRILVEQRDAPDCGDCTFAQEAIDGCRRCTAGPFDKGTNRYGQTAGSDYIAGSNEDTEKTTFNGLEYMKCKVNEAVTSGNSNSYMSDFNCEERCLGPLLSRTDSAINGNCGDVDENLSGYLGHMACGASKAKVAFDGISADVNEQGESYYLNQLTQAQIDDLDEGRFCTFADTTTDVSNVYMLSIEKPIWSNCAACSTLDTLTAPAADGTGVVDLTLSLSAAYCPKPTTSMWDIPKCKDIGGGVYHGNVLMWACKQCGRCIPED